MRSIKYGPGHEHQDASLSPTYQRRAPCSHGRVEQERILPASFLDSPLPRPHPQRPPSAFLRYLGLDLCRHMSMASEDSLGTQIDTISALSLHVCGRNNYPLLA